MAFTNSPLVVYTRISPNRTSPRNQPITKITVHHMAGVCSVEDFGNIVAPTSRQMSANYAIGNDGRIGLFCPEADRSWCSSSPWNDNRAITIEVSNSAVGGDWPIGDRAYNSLVKLCVDICKRNGIKKLYFDGTQNGSLTFHYMFWATACPGPWMKAHANDLCNKVNAQLGGTSGGTSGGSTSGGNTSNSSFKVNDLVKINSGARYYNGGGIPTWVTQENWYISSISGDRAVLGLNEAKNRNIQSPINTKDISLVNPPSSFKSYTKEFAKGTAIYDNPGGNKTGTLGGVFTIVDEKTVGNTVYGKLKSGKGWVIVKQTNTEIKKGDKVKVKSGQNYVYGTNNKFTMYVSVYTVLEINGDRVVISSDGKNVTTAIAKSNLEKV